MAVAPLSVGTSFAEDAGEDQFHVSNPAMILSGNLVRVAPEICAWAGGKISCSRLQALLFWCALVAGEGADTLLCACFLSFAAMNRLVAALSALPAIAALPDNAGLRVLVLAMRTACRATPPNDALVLSAGDFVPTETRPTPANRVESELRLIDLLRPSPTPGLYTADWLALFAAVASDRREGLGGWGLKSSTRDAATSPVSKFAACLGCPVVSAEAIIDAVVALDRLPLPPAFSPPPPLDGGTARDYTSNLRAWRGPKTDHDQVFFRYARAAIDVLGLTSLRALLDGVDDEAGVLQHLEKFAGSDHLDGDALRVLDALVAKHVKLLHGLPPRDRVVALLQVLAAAASPDRPGRDASAAAGSGGADDPSPGLTSRLFALSLEQPIASILGTLSPGASPVAVYYTMACTANFQVALACLLTPRQLAAGPETFRALAFVLPGWPQFLSHVIRFGDGLHFVPNLEGHCDALLDAHHHEQLPSPIPPALLAKLSARTLGLITDQDLLFVIAAAHECRTSECTRTVTSLEDRSVFYDWLELALTTWGPLLRALGFDALDDARGLPALVSELRAYLLVEPTAGHLFAIKVFLTALADASMRWALAKHDPSVSQLPAIYDPQDPGIKELHRLRRQNLEAVAYKRRLRSVAPPTPPPSVPGPRHSAAAAALAAVAAAQPPPSPAPTPGGKGGGTGAAVPAFVAGTQAGLFRETASHYELAGVFFHRSGVDTALISAGLPPVDKVTGVRTTNIAYLLVGSTHHHTRLNFCDPALGPVGRYPNDWFKSKLAKAFVDLALTATGKPAGWQLPRYFQ